MISIVAAYYNRKKLFINTLDSIKAQKYGDLEVIAVDDGSDESERLEDLLDYYPFLKVIRLEKKDKWYQNSCIPFNIGFKAAQGGKIIIQNPECLHFGNILEYTKKNLQIGSYLSFACFSLDKPSTENIKGNLSQNHISSIIEENNKCIEIDGEAGWYNHSVFRPKAYHFCTAISKKDLDSLGGFDELYALGIAFDDDDLLSRIKKKRLNIKYVDEEIVLHQNHYSASSTSYENRKYKTILYGRNEKLFNKLSNRSYYRANRISKFLSLKAKKIYIKIIINLLERV